MALGEAAEQGDVESVRLLLEAGASPHPVGETPEHTAAFAALMAEVLGPNAPTARLLGERPAEASAFQSFQIPLFQAAEGGSAECVRLLLTAGAVVHQRDTSARTALMYAASAEVVDALVEAGCDIHARDQYSNSALDHALENGQPEVLRALIAAGADLEGRDQYGNTALLGFCAAMEVDADMVRVLLEAGADIHARTYEQRTALHQAAQLWNGDRRGKLGAVIRVLVDAGLPVDVRDEHGRTPLHLAVDDEGGDVSAVKALLELGADVNAADRHGSTPLMVAVSDCHKATEIVPVLLAAGADAARADHADRTALIAAHARVKIWEQIVADPELKSSPWFTPEQYEKLHQEALQNAREVLAILERSLDILHQPSTRRWNGVRH